MGLGFDLGELVLVRQLGEQLNGPRTVTLSEPEPLSGNLIATPPHSAMMLWISFPPAPMTVLWNLAGIRISLVTMLAITLNISMLPAMVTMLLSLPESASSILVSFLSLILLMFAPPFPASSMGPRTVTLSELEPL